MTTPIEREKERIRAVTRLLHQACKPIRILRALDWAPEVKESFLAGGGRELPQVTYPPFDPTPSIDLVREARRQIVPFTTIDVWLDRHAQFIELGARMLAAVGTPSFFEFGHQLYGEPKAPLRYVAITPLELAQSVLDTITQLAHIEISTAPPAYHSAEEVAVDLDHAVRTHFGDQAPAIELVDRLSANALATSRAIRTASCGGSGPGARRRRRFSPRTYSMVMKGTLASSFRSNIRATFRWTTWRASFNSEAKRSTVERFCAISGRMSLRAISSPSFLSTTRKTRPIPPVPSSSMIW